MFHLSACLVGRDFVSPVALTTLTDGCLLPSSVVGQDCCCLDGFEVGLLKVLFYECGL